MMFGDFSASNRTTMPRRLSNCGRVSHSSVSTLTDDQPSFGSMNFPKLSSLERGLPMAIITNSPPFMPAG